MLLTGGSLKENDIFKKILSIGFEFETDELIKLSLHPTKNIFYNTNMSVKILEENIENGFAKIIKQNYVSCVLNKPTKEEIEQLNEDELEDLKTNYYDSEPEKFEEYFIEHQRKTDDINDVKFEITNDQSENRFTSDLDKYCDKLTIKKNDMYYLKTSELLEDVNSSSSSSSSVDKKFVEKRYELNFLNEDVVCNGMSFVEYVITYYNPSISRNLIINQFIDACNRILYHIDSLTLKTTSGKLFIAEDDSKDNYVNVKKNLSLYNKPNTNLHYLTTKDMDIETATFTPQMTFCSKSVDTIDIIKEIIKNEESYKGHRYIYNLFNNLTTYFETISNIAIQMLVGVSINTENEVGKSLHCYLFLMIYRLNRFIGRSEEIISKNDYLKNYLVFLPRHNNKDFYNRIKEIISKEYDISTFNRLFDQPELLKEVHSFNNKVKKQSYKKINKVNTDYGNPAVSLKSYFEHIDDNETDWLSQYEMVSTSFILDDDKVLLENRSFHREIALYLKYNVDSRFVLRDDANDISILEMKRLTSKVYTNLFINDDKKGNICNDNQDIVCVDKCKPGYYRNPTTQKCNKINKTKQPRANKTKQPRANKTKRLRPIKTKRLRPIKIKECKSGMELVNNNCLKICKEGRVRNTLTNRCKKPKISKKKKP